MNAQECTLSRAQSSTRIPSQTQRWLAQRSQLTQRRPTSRPQTKLVGQYTLVMSVHTRVERKGNTTQHCRQYQGSSACNTQVQAVQYNTKYMASAPTGQAHTRAKSLTEKAATAKSIPGATAQRCVGFTRSPKHAWLLPVLACRPRRDATGNKRTKARTQPQTRAKTSGQHSLLLCWHTEDQTCQSCETSRTNHRQQMCAERWQASA